PVSRDRRCVHGTVVCGEHCSMRTGGWLPYLCLAIEDTSGHDPTAVWRDGQCGHPADVPSEEVRLPLTVDAVPDPNRAAAVSGGEPSAVRRDRHRRDPTAMPGEAHPLPSGDGVPYPRRAVLAPGDEPSAVRRDRYREYPSV